MDLHSLVVKLKALHQELGKTPSRSQFMQSGVSDWQLKKITFGEIVEAAGLEFTRANPFKPEKPKIFLYDIETAPILANVWGLFDQNVGLNQIEKDWHLLSWSGKWLGEDEIFTTIKEMLPQWKMTLQS